MSPGGMRTAWKATATPFCPCSRSNRGLARCAAHPHDVLPLPGPTGSCIPHRCLMGSHLRPHFCQQDNNPRTCPTGISSPLSYPQGCKYPRSQ